MAGSPAVPTGVADENAMAPMPATPTAPTGEAPTGGADAPTGGAGALASTTPETAPQAAPAESVPGPAVPDEAPKAIDAAPSLANCQATHVAVGGYHGCAILGDGTVKCWGDGSHYQLGPMTGTEPCDDSGLRIPCSTPPRAIPQVRNAVELSLTLSDSCARDVNGAVFCWGASQSEVFSQADTEACELTADNLSCSMTPRAIAGIDHAVSLGGWGTHCAVEKDGTVQCWGAHMGAMPSVVEGVSDAIHTDFSCAVSAAGAAHCWWCNDRGQRGDGELGLALSVGVPTQCETSATRVAFGGEAVAISSGYHHACLLDVQGAVHCWGDNRAGQLGVAPSALPDCHGEAACAVTPQLVDALPAVRQVAAGYAFTCVLTTDGVVICPKGRDRIPVALPSPATQIAARYGQACAVLVDGSVYCWSPGGSTAAAHPRQVDLCVDPDA